MYVSLYFYYIHCLFTSLTDLKICGIFEDEVGSFKSPDLDADGYYENNVSCQWFIVSPYPTKVVQVYITDIDIPSDEHCSSDRLEVSIILYHDHFAFL